MPPLYLLFESASGYCLFQNLGLDEVGSALAPDQQSLTDLERFSKVVNLVAFRPFKSALEALQQINAISDGLATEELLSFLELNLPKGKKPDPKKAKYQLGVYDSKLGSVLQEQGKFPCVCNEATGELMRGLRMHLTFFIKQLEELDTRKSQLGLAHSFSRGKVQFNVNRVDNMVIQAIALLDTLDRDINTFVMRVREWYSWHFPELIRIVPDNYQYSRLALQIKNKSDLSEAALPGLEEIVGEEEIAKDILDAARSSMGQDISPIDLINIETFAKRVISMAEYRTRLHVYLHDKMHAIAPNLSALIGEVVGARLISHAGSLTNLAKCPASTVQILGAEKALFRALKTKSNTPKYGLIFHSSFIGRAKQRNKGRISRYLANKCSIASRIDCFMDVATKAFGERMKEQVEERLRFYEDGIAPGKNIDAMQSVIDALSDKKGDDGVLDAGAVKKSKKKRKRDTGGADASLEDPAAATPDLAPADAGEDAATAAEQPAAAKKKKSKKAKAVAAVAAASEQVQEAVQAAPPAAKKATAKAAVQAVIENSADPPPKKKTKTKKKTAA